MKNSDIPGLEKDPMSVKEQEEAIKRIAVEQDEKLREMDVTVRRAGQLVLENEQASLEAAYEKGQRA